MDIKLPSLLKPKFESVATNRVRVVTLLMVCLPVFALGVAVLLVPPSITRPKAPGEFWTLVSGATAVATLAVTLGIGAVAWFGLRSLRLARQDMETRAIRESRALAIAQAERFSEALKGEHREISKELADAGVIPFTHQVRSGAPIFDDPGWLRIADAWWATVPTDSRSRIIWFLNDLEAWAMYFTKALAEADVVYGPCAPTYCSLVMQYAPWIIKARAEQYSGFYPNILMLFHAWRAQLDAQERGRTMEVALKTAKAAEDRRSKHQVPAPLGTKVDL